MSSPRLLPYEPQTTAVPAWGMSLGLHVILFLAIALLVPATHVPQGPAEESRSASIVLVENTADRDSYAGP